MEKMTRTAMEMRSPRIGIWRMKVLRRLIAMSPRTMAKSFPPQCWMLFWLVQPMIAMLPKMTAVPAAAVKTISPAPVDTRWFRVG